MKTIKCDNLFDLMVPRYVNTDSLTRALNNYCRMVSKPPDIKVDDVRNWLVDDISQLPDKVQDAVHFINNIPLWAAHAMGNG